MEFVCDECGVSFNKNKNRLSHGRQKHQGMKRTDNDKRKSDIAVPKIVNISTDEAREPCADPRTCVEPVGSLATCEIQVFKMSFQCQECDQSFPYKCNLTRHIKTVHGNEPRKDNEARKEGLLKWSDLQPFEAQVESIPQTEFKSPAEYVTMAMKAHEDKQLTSEEFMQATGLSVFQHITDIFWTALYKRPDLYVYVTEEMLSWLGFEGESGNQKTHMIEALNARLIAYTYLITDDLSKAVDQVLQIPTEAYDRPSNYKHLLMRPLNFQV